MPLAENQHPGAASTARSAQSSPGPQIGAAQHGDLMSQHQELGFLEADDRLSRTSQPQSRTKIR